jgi:hypothetical protein
LVGAFPRVITTYGNTCQQPFSPNVPFLFSGQDDPPSLCELTSY